MDSAPCDLNLAIIGYAELRFTKTVRYVKILDRYDFSIKSITTQSSRPRIYGWRVKHTGVRLNAATLWRAATVVWNWGHITNRGDDEANRLERAQS